VDAYSVGVCRIGALLWPSHQLPTWESGSQRGGLQRESLQRGSPQGAYSVGAYFGQPSISDLGLKLPVWEPTAWEPAFREPRGPATDCGSGAQGNSVETYLVAYSVTAHSGPATDFGSGHRDTSVGAYGVGLHCGSLQPGSLHRPSDRSRI